MAKKPPTFPRRTYRSLEAADIVAAVAHLQNTRLSPIYSGGILPDSRWQRAREIAMYALHIEKHFNAKNLAGWFKVTESTARATLRRMQRDDPRWRWNRQAASEAIGYLHHKLDLEDSIARNATDREAA